MLYVWWCKDNEKMGECGVKRNIFFSGTGMSMKFCCMLCRAWPTQGRQHEIKEYQKFTEIRKKIKICTFVIEEKIVSLQTVSD
jgi:hypothetical protein